MLYFDTLPKVMTNDQNGNPIILTNIISRASLIEQMRNNPMLFYKYSIQDGDTPEIIAEKYYGDPYRYWIILYSNEIMDPVWDWPLTYTQFLDFINNKYKDLAEDADLTPFEYTQTTVRQYRKTITKTNSNSEETSTEIIPLTLAQYNALVENTQTYNISSTDSCTVTTTKSIQTLYDYEYELNEAKREINLLNQSYVNSFEETFKNLMV